MDKLHIERLQHTPIFGALRADALEFLLGQTRVVAVRAGAYFFREGEPARSMYVLEAGRALVLKGWQGWSCPCASSCRATASARWP